MVVANEILNEMTREEVLKKIEICKKYNDGLNFSGINFDDCFEPEEIAGLFADLKIEYLYLISCEFNNLPKLPTSLIRLVIQYSNIEELPDLSYLVNLQAFICNNNKLKYIEKLPNIQSLNIEYNPLEDDVFNIIPSSVTSCVLGHNNFSIEIEEINKTRFSFEIILKQIKRTLKKREDDKEVIRKYLEKQQFDICVKDKTYSERRRVRKIINNLKNNI